MDGKYLISAVLIGAAIGVVQPQVAGDRFFRPLLV